MSNGMQDGTARTKRAICGKRNGRDGGGGAAGEVGRRHVVAEHEGLAASAGCQQCVG